MTDLLTKDEAIALVREHSWAEQVESCGHRGCEEHLVDGDRYIHTYGSFGCDMSLEGAEQRIRDADEVGWSRHLLNHDLVAVGPDRRVLCFNVRRPVEEWAHA